MKTYIVFTALYLIASCSKQPYCTYCEAKKLSTGKIEKTFRVCGATYTDGHNRYPQGNESEYLNWDDKYFVDSAYSIKCDNYYD